MSPTAQKHQDGNGSLSGEELKTLVHDLHIINPGIFSSPRVLNDAECQAWVQKILKGHASAYQTRKKPEITMEEFIIFVQGEEGQKTFGMNRCEYANARTGLQRKRAHACLCVSLINRSQPPPARGRLQSVRRDDVTFAQESSDAVFIYEYGSLRPVSAP